MKIEKGKTYITMTGEKVEVVYRFTKTETSFPFLAFHVDTDTQLRYTSDGSVYLATTIIDDWKIVAEYNSNTDFTVLRQRLDALITNNRHLSTPMMTWIKKVKLHLIDNFDINEPLTGEQKELRSGLLRHGITGPRAGLDKEVADLFLNIYIAVGGTYFQKEEVNGVPAR